MLAYMSGSVCILPFNIQFYMIVFFESAKSMRRNRQCPTCREVSDVNADKLPTNYSILDFLNKVIPSFCCDPRMFQFPAFMLFVYLNSDSLLSQER